MGLYIMVFSGKFSKMGSILQTEVNFSDSDNDSFNTKY